MAVLHFSLHNTNSALDFMKLALEQVAVDCPNFDEHEKLAKQFKAPETNSIFTTWSNDEIPIVVFNHGQSFKLSESFMGIDDQHNLFQEREDVLIGDAIFSIERFPSSATLTFNVYGVLSLADGPHSLRRKVSKGNFNKFTITHSYNLARILEDIGHTNAATEIYMALVKLYPSFVECKTYYMFHMTIFHY
jgi:hypothetical protein